MMIDIRELSQRYSNGTENMGMEVFHGLAQMATAEQLKRIADALEIISAKMQPRTVTGKVGGVYHND